MSETVVSAGNLNSSARLCLDLSNTLEWRASNHPQESLTSYADLSDELGRVRECGGVGCGWLFVDVSRNCGDGGYEVLR